MSPELKAEVVKQAIHTFGTAGTLESDDGENMETCTWSNRGPQTRKGVMNSQMGQINDARAPGTARHHRQELHRRDLLPRLLPLLGGADAGRELGRRARQRRHLEGALIKGAAAAKATGRAA